MTQDEFWLIFCGLCGVVLQSLLKLDSLLKIAIKANVDFDWWRDYVRRDRYAITASFLSVIIFYLIFGEVATKFEWLTTFPRFSFVTIGMTGSYALQKWLGKSKKWLSNIIDEKSDIADKIKK